MSTELANDDDYIDYTQQTRRKIADHLMPNNKIPDDKDQLGALLATLDGMSRTALGNKKIKTEADGNKNTAAGINAIQNITERLGNIDPFRASNSTAKPAQQIDPSKLPPVNVVPGETDIGVSQTTYEEFSASMEAQKAK